VSEALAEAQAGQRAGPLPGRHPLGWALLIAGAAGAFTAVGVEVAGMGSAGFGLSQAYLLLVSLGLLAHGAELASRQGLAAFARLRAALVDVRGAAALAMTVGQLVLVALVTALFQVENTAFHDHLIPLTVVGFAVHHLVPAAWRQPFFVALSLTALVVILGTSNAAWLVALVGVFVAILHAPVSFRVRVALLLVAGGGLAALRGTGAATPWSSALWPVLGSMLMFRLVVYVYDQRHARPPIRLRETLAYLFLLPNVVFPLFPVVDFATFRRTYYDRPASSIHQEGLRWMLRGLTHLLLYRVVYQFGALAPSEVATTGDLLRYLLATFGLYLRVSGQFHLVVGILHLFGYRLPETHHLFYLASSFTDFWRRINIYWKDFMMKVVFYPVYLPLRRIRGETTALVVATLGVFFTTWVTHAYQWFWILGSWLLSWTDGLFWAALAVLLLINSLREAKKGRRRALPGSAPTPAESAGLALQTAGTFAVICVLWSFWGSESIGAWLDLFSVRAPTLGELGAIAGVLAALGAAAVLADRRERRRPASSRSPVTPARAALQTAAGFAALYAAGSPAVVQLLGPRALELARDLRAPELNARDAAALTRGYYENLTGVGQHNSQLWELYAQRPANTADIWASGVLRERPDFLAREMVPLFGTYQRGLQFQTNRWGMRDQDYEQVPPPDTYRVALLGQSYVAGDGVGDGATFEQVVEDRLNRERGPGDPRVEILNFAVGSFSIPQQALLLQRVLTFQPQTVVLVANAGDEGRAILHTVQQVRRGVPLPWPWLASIVERAGVTPQTREAEAQSRLKPYGQAIVEGAYREIVGACRARGVRPAWLYLGIPDRAPRPELVREMLERARAAGFATADFSDVYAGRDPATLRVSAWDFHPNAEGHRLIAERFHRELTTNGAMGLPQRSGG
jgi:D-alanyl-lipoteichoic acid acyltransferase DltB (MBOAT superfamily)